jgi:hypothetical protein
LHYQDVDCLPSANGIWDEGFNRLWWGGGEEKEGVGFLLRKWRTKKLKKRSNVKDKQTNKINKQ